jgi:formylglycine-generating enzyme required for sulfatase activity
MDTATPPGHLHIFIASADDVMAERAAAKAAVERVEKAIRQDHGVGLVPFLWQEDGTPCGEPAQDATNLDLDRADIVVFIFGQRLGEGTLVEYRRALANRKRDGRKPEVMVYFGEAPPPRDANSASAWARLLEFERDQHEVVRSARYLSTEGFEKRLREDLGTQVRAILKHRAAAPPESPASRGLPSLDEYLACLERRVEFLPMPGVSGSAARKVALLDLYVELRVRSPRAGGSDKDGARAMLGVAAQGGIETVLAKSLVALVGEPGSGKSTELRRIALRLARHHRGQDPKAPQELGFGAVGGAAPIPILLDLPWVADHLSDRNRLSEARKHIAIEAWAEVLEAHLRADGARVEAGDAERLLDAGGLLLLFDSLDEVSGVATRDKLAAAIALLSQQRPGAGRPNHFIVSCRARAWGAGTAFASFAPAELEPLDRKAVQRFAVKWGIELHGDTREGREAGTRLGEALAGPVWTIASNPQMLTMLAVIHHAGSRLPEQRSKLYEKCVDHLVHSRREALVRWRGSPGARRHLRLLAERMQVDRDSEGRARHAIDRAEAVALLMRALGTDEADDAREYLHDLEVCTGLLGADGRGGVRFHHRTFQEFLVAEVARDFPEGAFAYLAIDDRFLDAAWVEVVALTAGVLAEGGENGVRKLLASVVGRPQEDLGAWAPRVAVAARCLADLAPWHFDDSALAPAREALRAILPILEDREQAAPLETRIAVAEGLGRIHDPRLAPEARWISVAAGPAWRGAVPGDEGGREAERAGHQVWLSGFWIARWPVTVSEYREFVASDGYDDDEYWLAEGRTFRDNGRILGPNDWDSQTAGPGNLPVVGVSWWEAQAYCAWLSREGRGLPDGCHAHLPSEAQWEKAARGPLVRGSRTAMWPWGDMPDLDRLNCEETPGLMSRRLLPVGCFPKGVSAATGTWDQAGNAWEWNADIFDARGWPKVTSTPRWDPCQMDSADVPTYEQYLVDDQGRAIRDGADWRREQGHGRVVRGGGWAVDAHLARVSFRGRHAPAARSGDLGFRCAASPVALGLGPRR